jgi:hypothetical protein
LIFVRSGSSNSRKVLQRKIVVPCRVERRDEADDLFHPHPTVHRLVLGEIADAGPQLQRLPLRVEAQNADRPVVALEQPQQQANRGRLARRVPPQKRERLAALDGERHAAQHFGATERLVNGLHFDRGFGHGGVPSEQAVSYQPSAFSQRNGTLADG